MRSVAAFLFLGSWVVAGCGGSEEDPPPAVETPAPPDIDTGWPPGDLANLHVSHNTNTGQVGVYAAFTESSPGYVNSAECAIRGTICVAGFPSDEDEWEELREDQEIDQEITITRFAGYEITYGPYTLQYREDPDTHFGYYMYDATGEPPVEGWIGASWAGQYTPRESEEDLLVSPPIEITQPAIDDHIIFTNGEVVPIEWVPTGQGVVTLAVFNRFFTVSRIYRLKDDGYFGFDADSLGLAGPTEDLTFSFTRWNQSQLIDQGHVFNFVASSTASFTGQYIEIGAREYVTPADACFEAEGSLPLAAGNWWGFLGGNINNDLDPAPGPQCLFGGANPYPDARGPDAIFRVEVEPRRALSVDYNVFDQSAAVYVMSDCSNVNTCFLGNDTSDQVNTHEFLNYFNPDAPGTAARTVYLVADSSTPGASVYTLDVTLDELIPPAMYDSCDEAEAPPPEHVPVTSGNYYADFVAYTADFNPGLGGCTETSMPGIDAITPITLTAGQTLNVNVTMPGGDPGLYLLYNCRDDLSCPVGDDDGGINDPEAIVYQNMSAGSENLYIVVDSKAGGLRPYFLAVTIQ